MPSGSSGVAGGTSASRASIHAFCSAAQLSARRSEARAGMVRSTLPWRGSTESRMRRARACRRMVIGRSGSEPMIDQMMLEIARIILRYGPAAHRYAGAVHRLGIAADQIMPVGQRLALGAQPIGAGSGQPGQGSDIGHAESDAVRDQRLPMLIVGAAAAVPVEQATGDIGGMKFAAQLILHLMHAAFAAAIAQGLPFAAVQRLERLFPELH